MDHVDVDALVEDLQLRVAKRRSDGDYPPGLEEQLEAEFKIIMGAVHRNEVGTGELRQRIQVVRGATAGIAAVAGLGSRVPGGAALHGAASKVVQRHTGVLAESVRLLGRDISTAFEEVLRLFDVQRGADERQLNDVVGAVFDRIAVIDHLADAIVSLEARVTTLERGSPGSRSDPAS